MAAWARERVPVRLAGARVVEEREQEQRLGEPEAREG
jgi:hypothetical protein